MLTHPMSATPTPSSDASLVPPPATATDASPLLSSRHSPDSFSEDETSAGSPRDLRNVPVTVPAVESPVVEVSEDMAGYAVRLARVALMRIADAGDPLMGHLVARCGAEDALAQVRKGRLDPGFVQEIATRRGKPIDCERRLAAWRARLPYVDPEADLSRGEELGARLVVPGDVEWPTQLDDLHHERPLGLWLHGSADLRFACLRSVAIVGSRAATPYGVHVAAELAAGLSEAGWTIVSGGAYGIDAAAHRGALAGVAETIAVLACGTDVAYPARNHGLFEGMRARGLLVSECPPGVRPTRIRFLVRNRLIAALTRGTVVVEAAIRSGALSTASHAVKLSRHVAAVPGPVTSGNSIGCHRLIRRAEAVCVTTAHEVIELMAAIGDDLSPEPRAPVLPRDRLDAESRSILEAVPSRSGAGPATIAVSAGVDLMTTLSHLGALAAAGYVERTEHGWRLRRST